MSNINIEQLRLNRHIRNQLAQGGLHISLDQLCELSARDLLRDYHLQGPDLAQIVCELGRVGRALRQPEGGPINCITENGHAEISVYMHVNLATDERDTVGVDLSAGGNRIAHLDLLEALRYEAAEASPQVRAQHLRWTAQDLRHMADVLERLAGDGPDARTAAYT